MYRKFFLHLAYLIFIFPAYAGSQNLGGYYLSASLATAVHPNSCDAAYVTNFPNDSIWVNLDVNDSMTGVFSLPSRDTSGNDLLLETGWNLSNYSLSLLLLNGQYSTIHNVTLTDWVALTDINWQFIGTNCLNSFGLSPHFILPLDFNTDFGLTQSDTVIGIKIIFLSSPGGPDFAGAYIINQHQVGINEQLLQEHLVFYPNPFSDKIKIKESRGIYKLIIKNTAGENVYSITGNKKEGLEIDVKNLRSGIYFLEVYIRDEIVFKKLVKM